jgi:hypothetical protein
MPQSPWCSSRGVLSPCIKTIDFGLGEIIPKLSKSSIPQVWEADSLGVSLVAGKKPILVQVIEVN